MAKVIIPANAKPDAILDALNRWRQFATQGDFNRLGISLEDGGFCDAPDPVDPDASDFAALIADTDTIGMTDLARVISKEVPPHRLADFIDALVATQN